MNEPKDNTPEETVAAAQPAAATEEKVVDGDAIAAKFEKAAAFRNKLPKNLDMFVGSILVAFSLFQIYASIFTVQARMLRPIHLAFGISLVFLLYPATKKSSRSSIAWYDYILALLAAGTILYIPFNLDHIIANIGRYTQTEIMIGAIAIVLLFEACRRVVGLPILFIVGGFLLYTFFGSMIPGVFGHRGFNMTQTVTHMFFTLEGVFGTPLGVSATFIFLFVLFGAFLEKTGVGAMFIDLANAMAGRYSGGPAKVAIIASALQGSISGSSVANAASTGPFTIPAMKKLGYKPEFAGGVEAAASTGGQILPPVMGAAAFLMAETTGFPYATIVVAAIVPALLYFSGVLLSTHLEAKKLGLSGMDPKNIPSAMSILKDRGYLLAPLVIIVYLLTTRTTPTHAAMGAMLASIMVHTSKWLGIIPVIVMVVAKDIVGLHFIDYSLVAIGVWVVTCAIRRKVGMTIQELFGVFRVGARGTLSVVIACATAGIIVGAVTLTGVGLTFGNALTQLAAGNIYLLMLFTMIASLILGLGVPTTAKYLIIATVCAPAMIQALLVINGIDMPTDQIILSVHMFIFYFGVAADITPPVALASMATAAIADADVIKTSMQSVRLAIAGFIIPFIFVLSPAMLLVDSTFAEAAPVIGSAMLGMFTLSAGLTGYLRVHCSQPERFILIAAGIAMIHPSWYTDVFGIVVLVAVTLLHTKRKGALKAA